MKKLIILPYLILKKFKKHFFLMGGMLYTVIYIHFIYLFIYLFLEFY